MLDAEASVFTVIIVGLDLLNYALFNNACQVPTWPFALIASRFGMVAYRMTFSLKFRAFCKLAVEGA